MVGLKPLHAHDLKGNMYVDLKLYKKICVDIFKLIMEVGVMPILTDMLNAYRKIGIT